MAIPTYDRSANIYTGSTGPTAQESDFASGGLDAQTGRQFQGAAMGAAESLDHRRRQDEAAWVVNTVSQAQLHWQKRLQDLKNTAGSGAPGFTQNVMDEFDKFKNNWVDQAPSESSQRLLEEHLDNTGKAIQEHALGFQQDEENKKAMTDTQQYLDNASALVDIDPSKVADKVKEATSYVNAMQNRFPASEVDGMRQKATEELYYSAMGSLASTQPKVLLKDMMDGKWNGKVSGPRFGAMLEHLRAKVAETDYLGQYQQAQLAESNLKRILEDGTPLASLTEPAFSGKEAELNSFKYHQAAEANGIMHVRNTTLREGSPEARNMMMNAISDRSDDATRYVDAAGAPVQVGTPGAIDKRTGNLALSVTTQDEMNAATFKEFKRQEQLRESDGAVVGLQSKGVVEKQVAWKNAAQESAIAQQSGDKEKAAALDARATALRTEYYNSQMAAQIHVGVSPTNVRFATNDEAAALSDQLNSITSTDDLGKKVEQIKNQYGEHWGSVLFQMNNLPEGHRLLPMVNAIAANGNSPILGTIQKAMHTPEKVMNEAIISANEKPEDFQKGMYNIPVIKALWSATTAMGGNDQTTKLNGHLQQVSMIAKQLLIDKKASSVTDALTKAADAITPNKFVQDENGVFTLIPKNYSKDGSDHGAPFTPNDVSRVGYNLRVLKNHIQNLPYDQVNMSQFAVDKRLPEEAQLGVVRNMISSRGFWGPPLNGDPNHLVLWVRPTQQGDPFQYLGKDGHPIVENVDSMASGILSYAQPKATESITRKDRQNWQQGIPNSPNPNR